MSGLDDELGDWPPVTPRGACVHPVALFALPIAGAVIAVAAFVAAIYALDSTPFRRSR